MKARNDEPRAPMRPEMRPKKGTKKAIVAVNRQHTTRMRFPCAHTTQCTISRCADMKE
jgi:hypothetical protein